MSAPDDRETTRSPDPPDPLLIPPDPPRSASVRLGPPGSLPVENGLYYYDLITNREFVQSLQNPPK